ncbi:MAG: hypothetical protein U0M06_10300 [Clostridia bacterium]|nr:hypothetical protein [Clostridia bacterium]
MNWKNIKTFMLALLLCVNIFLCAMVANQTGEKVYNDDTLKSIKELLASSGIQADEKFFTSKTNDAKIFGCEIDKNYALHTANKLMGTYTDIFTTTSGFSFFGENGEVLNIDKDFSISFNSGTDMSYGIQGSKLENNEKEQLKKKLSDFLTVNPDDGFGIDIIDAQKHGDIITASLVQTINNTAISNHTLKCTLVSDKLSQLNGRWCFLAINENFSAHLLDSVNILFIEKNEIDEIGEEDSSYVKKDRTVKNIEQCYISHLSGDRKVLYLMPSWHIEWKENDIADTYYNAVNGEKTLFERNNVN